MTNENDENDENDENAIHEDSTLPPTWEADIKHFFTQADIGCMRKNGIDLADYATVSEKATADKIYRAVNWNEGEDHYMPRHARRWSRAKIVRFKRWIDTGRPRGRKEGSDVA